MQGALDELGQLAEHRHRDPAASLHRAAEVLAASGDPAVEAAARRVMGVAWHELNRFKEAVTSYRASIRVSHRLGLTELEALTRANLAMSLLSRGDTAQSEREMTQARAMVPAASRGVVEMLYGVCLHRAGQLDDALAAYQRARRWLSGTGDEASMALLYLNRGILLAYRGDPVAALDDLGEAERISRARDLPVLVAMATHNSGFAQGRRGDLPEALAAFARAERAYATVHSPARLLAILRADRCEVLLLAGLVDDAGTDARAAVAALDQTGDMAHLTECRLLLARAHLAAGDHRAAVTEASLAARQFGLGRRLPWAALARYVAIQAEILAVQDTAAPPGRLLSSCRRIALELAAQGWPVEAVHVRTFAGRVALALGRPGLARAELALAVPARTRGTADLRAQAWHATALLRLAEGDRAGAKRALTRGMGVVDDYQATLGATEMRVRAAGHAADLARLGTRLALQDRNAVQVLRWAERWRAVALRRPPVRPPHDEELAARLTELRSVRADLRDSALRGAGDAGADRRAAALEEEVRISTLQARDNTAATGRVDVAALRRAVGDRLLVEFVNVDGWLYAVTVARSGIGLRRLAPSADVAREKQYLLFAMRRQLWTPLPEAAADALQYAAGRLDELLLQPLELPARTALVVVPTGVLHGLPWSTLPTVAGRDTTIAPSSALWLGAAPADAAKPSRVTLVAGPGLPGADSECRAISRLYRGSHRLAGDRATAANVLAALEYSDVVHIAAHGRFRADSPLFSSMLLSDGPLTIYDLERLQGVAGTVVLAACDAAVAAVEAGDEPLGTAAALVGLGVRSVIAPVMAVPDGRTVTFMLALHRRLRAGERPSAALAGASCDQPPASAFVCVGGNDAGCG